MQHPIVAMQTVKVGNAQSILVETSINDSFEGIEWPIGNEFFG